MTALGWRWFGIGLMAASAGLVLVGLWFVLEVAL
jgi:hypothetical protein